MNALTFKNVSVTYPNGFCAVRAASFEIKPGECLAIVGESGSGKTTLARAALGLLPENTKIEGSILVDDTEIVGASAQTLRRLRGLIIGFVAQEPFSAFNPLAKVFDHVAEAWRVHAKKPPRAEIFAALADLGIAETENAARQFPHEWSGGMLQRATIAAANAHRPKLIVADEPTSALDAPRADAVLRALRETGAAVLLVSHDLNLVARRADRIAVCLRGEIIETGATGEILENPQHDYTKNLLEQSSRGEANSIVQTGAAVLRAENLSRVYSTDYYGVQRADLEVRRGEIVGIGGESGSGKSTLLRLLATIETPSSGRVFLGGELATNGGSKKITSRNARNGFVALIFQNPLGSLDARWAIWRSVTEPLSAKHRRSRLRRGERQEIARRILAEVGLAAIDLEARPSELSIGQCQRVCIARALVAAPAVILADEPTSALDAALTKEILRLLAAAAVKGIAVVIVSHDEAALRSVCHRVLLMRDGVLEDETTGI